MSAAATTMPGWFGGLFGVGAVIFLPIFYGVLGAIGGALAALIYNIIAGMVGGLRSRPSSAWPEPGSGMRRIVHGPRAADRSVSRDADHAAHTSRHADRR